MKFEFTQRDLYTYIFLSQKKIENQTKTRKTVNKTIDQNIFLKKKYQWVVLSELNVVLNWAENCETALV